MGRGLTGQVPSEERIQTVWEEARVGGEGGGHTLLSLLSHVNKCNQHKHQELHFYLSRTSVSAS